MAPGRQRPLLGSKGICEKSGERKVAIACTPSSADRDPAEGGGDPGGAEPGGVVPWGAEREVGEGTGSLYPAGGPGGWVSSSSSGDLSGLPCLQYQPSSAEGVSIKLGKLGKSDTIS